jgi:superfamily I DNA/RNA helicase
LTQALRDSLRLLESDDEILSRIDVSTVDQVARRTVGGRFTLLTKNEERELWRNILRRRSSDFSESFVAEEWRQVALAQDLADLDAYLMAKRVGRGRRLGPVQRAQIWRILAEFEGHLVEGDLHTFETVCRGAARLLEGSTTKPYDHVIVDEAQDLHPVRWRVLRAAVAQGPDDLFIAGDVHQRIYDNRVSLGALGIQVAGRSTNLTINYRTTAEILNWSCGMLSGEKIESLAGDLVSLTGCRSEVHGSRPELFGASTKTAELERLARTVEDWLAAGVLPEEIGIAARSAPLAQEAVTALARAGIAAEHVSRERPVSTGQVPTMTMHRMKGLEFRCVAVIGVSSHALPATAAITPLAEDSATHWNDLRRERCLLFVACTRARERLALSWHGRPSPFLG